MTVTRLRTAILMAAVPLVSASCQFMRLSRSPAPTPAAKQVDPHLMLAVSEFQAHWQSAWRVGEEHRTIIGDPKFALYRWNFYHCSAHVFRERGGTYAWIAAERHGVPGPQYDMIEARQSSFAVCPSWLLSPTLPDAQDESKWRDGALRRADRPAIEAERAILIEKLERVFAADRGDDWLTGQLVRFYIDARDFAGARRIVDRCRATAWWCTALEALVHARSGDLLAADSAFAFMRQSMTDDQRCNWEDLGKLLPPRDLAKYKAVACAARDTLNARIWWLADPLWREPVNERLVEQEVRRVEIALRQASHQDERWAFDDERGGDAVATVIERYGWPSYTAWGWREEDYNRDRYLLRRHSPPTAPYTSFEYTLGRARTIPSWRAIATPFDAVSGDWQLVVEDSLGNPSEDWWPEEHFNPSRRLVQLPDGQTVTIRRQGHVEVATALELSHPAMRTVREHFDVMLLATTGPNRIDSIAQHDAAGGATVFLRGVVSPESLLIGIEALGRGTTPINGRTRFSYTPPRSLSTMRPREIALSDIALLSPLPEPALRTPHDTLLRALLPTRTLSSGAKSLVLYWENYGILPSDSSTVVVRVASQANIGVLRRVGMAAGVASDPNSYVEIRWKDHEARGGTTTLYGPVPVQMRTLSLDLRSLKPGRYVIEVAMLLKDGRSAERQVIIELLP